MTDTIHFVKPRLLLVMISLCAPCRNLTAAESAPAPSLEHLWPAYRHDNSLAGISPLRGGLGKRPTLSWSIDLGAAEEPSETWRFADLDGDGTNDFLRILGNRLICESIGGDRLWESATLSQPAVLQMRDFAGNGRIGLLVKSETGTQTLFHMIDGATGESALLYTMQNVFGHWTAYATPLVVDLLGGEQRPHVFMSRAFALTAVIDLEGNPRWHYGLTRDTTARSHAGIGDLDGDGKREIVTSQADGLLRAFSAEGFDATCPSCPPGQELNADTRAGHIRWEYKLQGPLSDFASADLDGDGRHELLVGCGDGLLRALKEVDGGCVAIWEYDFHSPLGSPVLADLDADGTAEILVPVADGYLHCLRE